MTNWPGYYPLFAPAFDEDDHHWWDAMMVYAVVLSDLKTLLDAAYFGTFHHEGMIR